MINLSRLPFLLLAIFCLLTGLWTGLSRIGWDIFILPATAQHGGIMVGGFLGTLISLEKVIPLKQKYLLLIPLMSTMSVVLSLLGQRHESMILLVLASSGLTTVFIYYFSLEMSFVYGFMLAGSISWLTGNILLLTRDFYPLAFPWWVAFILFIIAAERLELMKFLPVSKSSKKFFAAFLIIFLIGVISSFHGIGNILSGIALICVATWLMRNDVVGISFKKENLPGYVAVSLLCGYVALLLTGILFITFSNHWLAYDALVHTFFLGFAFSMIFAHGPIILPGLLGSIVKPFHKILYLWLVLLHSSWLLRIFADAHSNVTLRKISGLISAIAIVSYFVTMAFLTIRAQRHGKIH